MKTLQTPFRYDYVGSFLRPQKLKEARRAFDTGRISHDDLKKVEDEAITELIGKLKELGYPVLTDGEFRRATWHLDFMWAFDGIGHEPTKTGLPFHGEAAMIDDTYIDGKLGLTGEHPFVEHFRFVKQYAAGCRNLQLDDCTWGMLADKIGPSLYGTTREGALDIQKKHRDINNRVIAEAPLDMIVNTHVCRGNFHSTFANSGPYDGVADILFGEENVNAYYLEFDDERSGGFSPLAKVSGDKKVVLGLVTTKSPKLESRQVLIDRIHQAARYIPLERLCLSPQCGFASCEIGNKLTQEEQWAKLRLVKEVAEEVWG